MDPVTEHLIETFKKDNNYQHLSREDAFEALAAYCILGRRYRDGFDPNSLMLGGPGDLGLDAAAIMIDGELYTDPDDIRQVVAGRRELKIQFFIIQAKAKDHFEPSVFTALAVSLIDIFGPEPMKLNANPRVKQFRKAIDEVFANRGQLAGQKPTLKAWYVTGGVVNDAVLAPSIATAEQMLSSRNLFATVKLNAIGADEVHELYVGNSKAVTATIPLASHFEVPAIHNASRAIVCLAKARDVVTELLTDAVGNIRSFLFQENVRAFLGYGVTDENGVGDSVNAQIRATLRDANARDSFAILNNGLTIVARELDPVGPHHLTIKDFSIVNGCQTSYVLFDERSMLDENVYIGMRVIETSNEGLISAIVAATNRQNAVTPSDLQAREILHQRLEKAFVAWPADRQLFYERRLNQYDGMSIEKTRIISRRELAKSFAAMFLDEAHRATRLGEVLNSRGGEIFRPNDRPLQYYVCAATYYRVEWLLRNRRLPSIYGPAKFHLIAGVRYLVLGPDRLPVAAKAFTKQCNQILDAIWPLESAEAICLTLEDALLAALSHEPPGTAISQAARTSRFRIRMINEVVARRAPQ